MSESKQERRWWVQKDVRPTIAVGEWICGQSKARFSVTIADERMVERWPDSYWHVWTGCTNPLCMREEPHEIGIVECRMPKAPEMPGAHFEMTFADPSVPQVTKPEDTRSLRDVYADAIRSVAPDAIHTEAQLARALFIAMNEAEVVRRCELRESGENVRNLLTERCRAVVTTMMADPAYAKERDAAERLASRTWSARRVGR